MTEVVTLLDYALRYAALGWPVVPLHTPDEGGACDCPKREACGTNAGKHPRTMHGLDDATTDEAVIRRWWAIWPHANIAIDLARAGLVDIAPDSVEWFAEFTARGLPETLSFASGGGNGHEHHLYVRSEDCPIYRLTETGKYDILSAGYPVMPPSRHRLGGTYTWLRPTDLSQLVTLPDLAEPAWAKGMLLEKTRRRSSGSAPAVERVPGEPPVDLRGDALERWHGRLCTYKPDGSVDRSWSLWQLAVDLLAAGLKPWLVEECLADRDIALGWEKFPDRGAAAATARYRIIVARAVAGKGSKRIRLSGRQNGHVEAEPAAPRKPSKLPLAWETIDEFNASEDTVVRWSVFGMLGQGLLTELDGRAKRSGKTTLLLAMCAAILHREPFLNQPTMYSPIVYLTEQSGPSFKDELQHSGLVDGDAFHLLRWTNAQEWAWPDLVAEAVKKVEAIGGCVLIIDTFVQFAGIHGDDENKSGSALELLKPLQAAQARGLSIMISRHDRKGGGDVGESGRGSSAFTAAADIVLHLVRPEAKPGNKRQRVLNAAGRFDGKQPDELLVELGETLPWRYEVVGNVQQIRVRDTRIEIQSALPSDPDDAIDRAELDRRVPGRSQEIHETLNVMRREGLVGTVKKQAEGPNGRKYLKEFFWLHTWRDDDD